MITMYVLLLFTPLNKCYMHVTLGKNALHTSGPFCPIGPTCPLLPGSPFIPDVP